MLILQIFAWISYSIICIAACIVIYDFLEEKLPVWRRKKDKEESHERP